MTEVSFCLNIYAQLVRGTLMLSIIFLGTYRKMYQVIQEGYHLIQLVYTQMRRYSREAQESWRIGRTFNQMQKRLI